MLMLLLLLDLDLIGTTTSQVAAAIGGGESGVEDSEEDEEWNYIKVEDKKSQSELGAVDENIIEQSTAPFIEEKQELEGEKELIEEEPPTAPIEFASKEFEFNVSMQIKLVY